ncbi:MAG: hypothetical protein WCB19_09185 [Thermoplasmata archaeon]
MNTVNPPFPSRSLDDSTSPARWILLGLAVMFVLIGVGVLLSIVASAPSFTFTAPWATWASVWAWVIGAFVFAIFVLIVVSIARFVTGGFGAGYLSRRYFRHYGRWGRDPAVDVARERFARGEITREQLDQIWTELERHESTWHP